MKQRKRVPTNDEPRVLILNWRDQLVAERRRRGLRQADVADMLGMSQSQIARIESDPFSIKAHVLFHLAKGYGMELVMQPRQP